MGALAQNAGTVKMTSTSSTSYDLTYHEASATFTTGLNTTTSAPSNYTYCYTNAHFTEKTYFLLMFVLFFVSGVAFFLINILPNPVSRRNKSLSFGGGSGCGNLAGVKRNASSATSSRSTNASENGSDD